MSITNIIIPSEIQNNIYLETIKNKFANDSQNINSQFLNDYLSEYQLKINKFDPQKNLIKNNWEKRLLFRINSISFASIYN